MAMLVTCAALVDRTILAAGSSDIFASSLAAASACRCLCRPPPAALVCRAVLRSFGCCLLLVLDDGVDMLTQLDVHVAVGVGFLSGAWRGCLMCQVGAFLECPP